MIESSENLSKLHCEYTESLITDEIKLVQLNEALKEVFRTINREKVQWLNSADLKALGSNEYLREQKFKNEVIPDITQQRRNLETEIANTQNEISLKRLRLANVEFRLECLKLKSQKPPAVISAGRAG